MIPLSFFGLLMVLFFPMLFFVFRGVREDGAYLDNIIFNLLAIFWAFYLSKISVNGTVVTTNEFLSSTDTVISSSTPMYFSSLGYFWEFTAVAMFFVLILLLWNFVKSRRVEIDY